MGIEVGLLALAAAGTIYSIDQQKEAAKDAQKRSEKSAQLHQKRADVSSARERARQVRQARAQRATAVASAQSGEGTGGSGLAGAQANIGSQTGSNLSFLSKNEQISKQLSDLNVTSAGRISRANTRASVGSGVASIATSAGSIVKTK